MQTLQPEKYLKWINELQSDICHMVPILTNCKDIHHTLTYRKKILHMIIPLHMIYSPTYQSVETDDMHHY